MFVHVFSRLAWAQRGSLRRVLGDGAGRDRSLITPPPVVEFVDPIALPAPEHPAAAALVDGDLGGEVVGVPRHVLRVSLDAELGAVLHVAGHGERELADDHVRLGPVQRAGRVDVTRLRVARARVELPVHVVVEVEVRRVIQISLWVAGAPVTPLLRMFL